MLSARATNGHAPSRSHYAMVSVLPFARSRTEQATCDTCAEGCSSLARVLAAMTALSRNLPFYTGGTADTSRILRRSIALWHIAICFRGRWCRKFKGRPPPCALAS